jgi:hypothetical protein
MEGRLNNNRMERYHSTFKGERVRPARGIKTTDTAILDGQRIYYNHYGGAGTISTILILTFRTDLGA